MILTLGLGLSFAKAEDWLQWRGLHQEGISQETDWNSDWSNAGPKVLWEAQVGIGFASFVVAGNTVIATGNRDEHDTVYAFDTESGQLKWKHRYPAKLMDKYFEGGTTGTPTIHEGVVYQLSRWGDLFALDLATGKVIWSKKIHEETGLEAPEWGYSGAPVVWEDSLILNVGSHGVRVRLKDGSVVWKAEQSDAGYSTPKLYEKSGEVFAILGRRKGYVAVNVKDGKEAWQIHWNTTHGINAADPIVHEDHVFISTGYNKGAGLFPLGNGELQEVWKSREMRNQMNGSVRIGDYVYGPDGDLGRGTTKLKCLEFKTGTVKWALDGYKVSAITIAGERMLVMGEDGELITLRVNPDKAEILSTAKVLSGRCWTVPVLSNGQLYVRNAEGKMLCLDLR